ncbi:hypothetical protein GQ53DRAFT_754032 [Thozetella sp. PMI_491]|nr:hypothetical protein GQ53DRAFT_754032 [Thozetella sp. PMI_491]
MSGLAAPTGVPEGTKVFWESNVQAYFKAWVDKDMDAGLSYFLEDSKFDDYHMGVKAKDKSEVRGWLEMCFRLLNNITYDVISISGDHKHFVVEGLMAWKYAEDFQEAKKGQADAVKGVSVLEFNDQGKILYQRDYYIPLKKE